MAARSSLSLILTTVILLTAIYFTLFLHLDRVQLAPYDESCYAMNAVEMMDNGNPLVVTLFGRPERYNTKPPFGIWCMVAAMKMIGVNELGARFASAFFSALTALLIFFFGRKYFQSDAAALFGSLVLLSSYGYVNWHIARTGDLDSILAFWICFYVIHFFNYTQTSNSRYLYFTAIGITLACLTKGIAGITAVPALILWMLYSGSTVPVFRSRAFYIGLLLFVVCVPGYYLLRNLLDPGYLDAVITNEVGGRLARQPLLNLKEVSFDYYLWALIEEKRFIPWIYILPLSLIAVFFSSQATIKRTGLYVFIAIASVGIMISSSGTKFEWYDAPLFPLLSLGCAIGFAALLQAFENDLQKKAMICAAFVCLAMYPLHKIVMHNLKDDETYVFFFPKYLEHIRKDLHVREKLFIVNADFDPSLFFYTMLDARNGHQNMMTDEHSTTFSTGDLLIPTKEGRFLELQKMYELQVVDQQKDLKLLRVIAKKTNN